VEIPTGWTMDAVPEGMNVLELQPGSQ